MTRLNQTLLMCAACAALVAPRAARADETQDPRAQVTAGFGPLSHAPRTRPAAPQGEEPSPATPVAPALSAPRVEEPVSLVPPAMPAPGRARVQVPWGISMAGVGFGSLIGGAAGFGLSLSFIDCSGSFFGFPSLQCLGGVVRSAAIGLGTGVAGGILGGWAVTALYRSQPSMQVVPVVGNRAQGLAISGTF
jgi:hypothetical protein